MMMIIIVVLIVMCIIVVGAALQTRGAATDSDMALAVRVRCTREARCAQARRRCVSRRVCVCVCVCERARARACVCVIRLWRRGRCLRDGGGGWGMHQAIYNYI